MKKLPPFLRNENVIKKLFKKLLTIFFNLLLYHLQTAIFITQRGDMHEYI